MESLLSLHSEKFDAGVMDRFLNYQELPVLGTTALEQVLHQMFDLTSATGAPPPASGTAMSPDSSQWTASTSGVESGSESVDGRHDDLDCMPDSTTNAGGTGSAGVEDDRLSVNSDPINSSGSEYSFAASPPVFEHLVAGNDDFGVSTAEETNNNNKRPAPVADIVDTVAKKRTRKSKIGPTDLACPLCEYTTRVKEHLASHMNSHASERKYMCNQCGQTFKWSHSLRRHQRTHQKDYKYSCSYCPKSFSRKDHLAVHEKLHDSENAESFPCAECGVTFKNKKTLTGHMKTHSADKPYKCASCESEFTRKASLTRHELAAHAGQVFHCNVCHAPFSYKSTLEDHRRAVHNEGKRDFHCLACGLSFACKAYLQKHMGVCKNRSDREEVPCPDCGARFPTRRQAQEHRRNKHKKPANCPQNMGHGIQYVDKYRTVGGGGYLPSAAAPVGPTVPLPSFSSQTSALPGYPLPPPPQYGARQAGGGGDNAGCHAGPPTTADYFMVNVPQAQTAAPPSAEPLMPAQGPVTVSELQLPFEPEPLEENFGSILRQVYDSEHSDFGAKNGGNPGDSYINHMTMLYDLL